MLSLPAVWAAILSGESPVRPAGGATITLSRRRSGHAGGVLLAVSNGGPSAQATERSANQCRGDPPADEPARQAASRAATRGGGASLRLSSPGESISAARRAAHAGGVRWGWVCSREQRGGMESKVAVVCSQTEDLPMPVIGTTFSRSKRGGPRRPPRQRHRLVQRRYVATFGPSRQIGAQAKATLA
jgi:hypothetical protein